MTLPHTDLLIEIRQQMFVKKILTLLDLALETNTIDSKTHKFLKIEHPIIPVFYFLPKMHKNLQNPPGRHIVASTDSVFSPLAKHLEKVLTPLVKQTRSFLRDTGKFLDILQTMGPIPNNS